MHTKGNTKTQFLNCNVPHAYIFVVALAIIASALLAGCSNSNEKCHYCGDSVDKWIYTESQEVICASCFSKDGWQVCVCCSNPYKPDGNYTANGMCYECTENNSWYCEICEDRYAFEHLVDLNNGHYVCANCITPYFLECDTYLRQEIEESPVFESYQRANVNE